MKKWKIDRIISIATLVSSLLAIYLVLKRPQPVAAPQPRAAAMANAQSFQEKLQQLDQPKEPGQSPAQVRLNSDEVSAALAQAAGALPLTAALSTAAQSSSPADSTPQLQLPANVPSSVNDAFAVGDQPEVKDYQVSFEGDIARGQFVTQIGGKTVYVTLAGHLGSKDGYATFDPTEFKVGDLNVPVSLVNSELQKRLEEQKDRLKLPNDVGDIKVENGQLVMTQK